MRFVIKEEDSKTYKQAILLCASLAALELSNPIEGCIEIRTGKDEVFISCLNSNSHYLKLSCPALVQKEGLLYIGATSLLEMSKGIDKNSLVVSLESNNLIYTVPVLGSIKESIYHNQDGYSLTPLNPKEEDIKPKDLVVENSSILGGVFKSIASTAVRDKAIRIRTTKEHIDVYGVYGEAGSLRFRDVMECYEEVDMCMDVSVLKTVSSLGTCLSIRKGDNLVEFSSDIGTITCYSTPTKNEYKSMDAILKLAPMNSIEISSEDLDAAIRWQSYKTQKGDSLLLSMGKELKISSPKMEPSTLTTRSSSGEEGKVTVSLSSFGKVLSVVRGELICIERREIPIGNKKAYVLSIRPSKKVNGSGIGIINEQVTL
jgi:hypothetical protein